MTRRILIAFLLSFPLSIYALTPRSASDEEAIVEAMNRERAAEGLAPLHLNRELCDAANDRVHDMFAQHYFAHVAPDGTSPFVSIDRHGYTYRHAGENLAVGYQGAEAVVDGWMHSPGHRANVLGSDYVDVGVAIAVDSPARPYGGPLVVAIYGVR
jgi:uncharacterized protein YkwD